MFSPRKGLNDHGEIGMAVSPAFCFVINKGKFDGKFRKKRKWMIGWNKFQWYHLVPEPGPAVIDICH
jgi:hypothetical protein